MGFFNRVIAIIKKYTANLNKTERALFGMIAVIMVIAFFWAAQVASQKEMVPLLDQNISEDQVKTIVNKLNFWGMEEDYELKGNEILVPKTQRWKIFYKLTEAEAMPQDISVGFERLLEDDNVFTSDAARKDKKQIILQVELARGIETFSGVSKATVIINPGNERKLLNITPESSAAVIIESDGRLGNKKNTASSVAALVSGAVNRLKRENVKVVIDGSAINIAPDGEEYDSDVVEALAKVENYYMGKIYDVVKRFSPDAAVVVDLKLDKSRRTEETSKVLKDGEGTVIYDVNKKTVEDNSTNRDVNNEPGLVANASNNNASNNVTSAQTSEVTDTEKNALPGHSHTVVETPPGEVPLASRTATVMLPWSYFKGVAIARLGLSGDVTVDQVNQIVPEEVARIKKMILPAMGLTDDMYVDNVTVDYFWGDDVTSALASGGGAGAAGAIAGGGDQVAGMSVASIMTQYGKHIAISALAFFAIIMALVLVRKAVGPPEIIIEEDEPENMVGRDPIDAFSIEDANLDGEDGSLLAGLELGEEAVRSQQILEQIRSLVSDNPDMAAGLLSKWIKQGT